MGKEDKKEMIITRCRDGVPKNTQTKPHPFLHLFTILGLSIAYIVCHPYIESGRLSELSRKRCMVKKCIIIWNPFMDRLD